MVWMRQGVATAIVMVIAAALVTGCDSDNRQESDVFVGTWRQLDYRRAYSAPLVISRHDDKEYAGEMVFLQGEKLVMRLTRDGYILDGYAEGSVQRLDVRVEYLPE